MAKKKGWILAIRMIRKAKTENKLFWFATKKSAINFIIEIEASGMVEPGFDWAIAREK